MCVTCLKVRYCTLEFRIDPIALRKYQWATFLHPSRLCRLDKGVSRAEDCNPCYCRHRPSFGKIRAALFVVYCSHRPEKDYLRLLFILIQTFCG